MTNIKNKILILLDGSEEFENSLNILTETNILNSDQIVLFFVLNPFNPVTKGQEKEVLYNDFVHDHGRRLATLYIEKIESLIHSKNLNIEVSHNIVNSYENIQRRIALGDIDIAICSVQFSNKLDYIFRKSKKINYFINKSKNILVLPYEFTHNPNFKNNFIIPYSEFPIENTIDKYLNYFNFDRITLLYDRKSSLDLDNFILEFSDKKFTLEKIEINSEIYKNLMELSKEYNLIFFKEMSKKITFLDNFKKFSNYSLFTKKIPVLFNK